ncbi:hypothetical protein NC796_14690 [Aliifodinibius sp. S!AR15-10]|uniref:enolase C-terminal domain-like protein n=1 Tax=Aliifodinibius sp. S!AR15-10 TaxID=2950437 RepID=UPI0028560077|nr:enolase C-terminal domain-like protein [Aliifodinibius sp. S!AR15-10]MDR8392398.1 hypothetical protein [Aliifodinibius sp. S!AR15-10]
MKRQNFLQLLTAGTGAAAAGKVFSSGVGPQDSKKVDQASKLANHTISEIEFREVKLNYPRQVGKNAQLDIHGFGPTIDVGIIHTDKGIPGLGMLQAWGDEREQAGKYIKGKAIPELFDPSVGIIDDRAEAFDIPLHDLAGKILEQPVYELLGRKTPFITNCYSGMIYFDDLEPADNPAGVDKIIEECKYDYDVGYRQFKLKIGRGNKWMPHDEGMKRDIEVTRLVAENFPDCDILVDANNGYNLEDTITYLEGIGDVDLFWFEEPFHENHRDYLELRKWMLTNGIETFLSDGEANPDHELLMDLCQKRILDFHLTDIAGYGFTAWRKLMPRLTHLAGGLGNTPTIEGVTCDSDDIDFGDYELNEGKLTPSSEPGFGMKLISR